MTKINKNFDSYRLSKEQMKNIGGAEDHTCQCGILISCTYDTGGDGTSAGSVVDDDSTSCGTSMSDHDGNCNDKYAGSVATSCDCNAC